MTSIQNNHADGRMTMEQEHFNHRYPIRVRNYEIDWQGIVHNGNYLLYCEVGRVEYLKYIGAKVDLNTITGTAKVVLVRNEIDYKRPARLHEDLTVLTRIASVRNTSFTMEGMILNAAGDVICENVAYHVWLDPTTDRPTRVPDDFRRLVRSFEGKNCRFEERKD